METENITGKFKMWFICGLTIPIIAATAIGYGSFKHFHPVEVIQIENAKVAGAMISVRSLVDGKVSEYFFNDGDEVEAGDVIARLEVDVNEETIAQLENAVNIAKYTYEDLKLGQVVKVPVKRVRVVPGNSQAAQPPKSSSLAALEERAERMEELFEMGAISKNQRDAAVAAYEDAKARSGYNTMVQSASEPTYVEEVEYIDQWQPTPLAALQNAENAVKQAELSLNVAKQEAQETQIIAPISGTIHYIAKPEKELVAGNSIARIGDINELWLVAEVSESIFNKVQLGKPVDYILEGRNLSGTVIEKITPTNLDKENLPEWIPPNEETAHPEFALAEENKNQYSEPINDKFLLKFSIPADLDFECKLNTTTNVKIKLYKR